MPGRRLLAVGLWLCVTAAATAIVWAGTSTVAADLTDRPAPVVAHQDVVNALQSDAPAPETAPGISAPEASGPPPTVTPGGSGPALATPGAALPGTSPSASPSAGTATPPPAPETPPITDAASPPTTQAPKGPTATYSTAGGVVTVACRNSFFIELVSATPNNGYSVNVVTGGPYFVEVHFVRAGRDEPVWAYCLGQPVRAYGGTSIPGLPH